MSTTNEIENLRAVIRLCREEGMTPTSIQVGDLDVTLLPTPSWMGNGALQGVDRSKDADVQDDTRPDPENKKPEAGTLDEEFATQFGVDLSAGVDAPELAATVTGVEGGGQ